MKEVVWTTKSGSTIPASGYFGDLVAKSQTYKLTITVSQAKQCRYAKDGAMSDVDRGKLVETLRQNVQNSIPRDEMLYGLINSRWHDVFDEEILATFSDHKLAAYVVALVAGDSIQEIRFLEGEYGS